MSSRSTGALALTAAAVMAAAAVPVDASPTAQLAGAAPSVQTMVVGASGHVLSEARTVSASVATVRVGARSCAVASGTPLAALAALRRGGGPAFLLRDYAHCGASAANSSELFVYSLGGEANRAQNGWEYKVNGVSGSTGAGDPSGPSGNGTRLSSGEQVLWFWCQASGAGCERTLRLSASSSTVHPNRALTVAVSGQENEGHSAPVAGAIVALDSDFASTGSNGRATLIAPATPGSYQLRATARGLVPSFPETIVVR
jgi:hypothetical protein